MINSRKLVGIMESHAGEGKSKHGLNDHRAALYGIRAMHREVTESLGIQRDHFGRPTIKAGSIHPTEYDIVEIAEAIGDQMGFKNFGRSLLDRNQHLEFHGMTALEAGPGIDPTAFQAINLWTSTVAGLVEAQVIQKFMNPEFIGDKLTQITPTKLNGQKFIGVTGIGNKAQTRNPGEPHPRAGFGAHTVTTPELIEKSLAVEVTKEADFYDLSGQVLDTASGVGDELSYLKELTQIDLVLGITNPYVYNDVGYDTYQDTAPWINKQQNEFADYKDIGDAKALFSRMTDPVTGKKILVTPNQILCHTDREMDFAAALTATEVRNTTNTNTVTISGNPLKTKYEILSSPIVDSRLEDADGLNLSTNAKKNWLLGNFQEAFMWMEAWPVRVSPVAANEYVMRDRGLIAAFFANYRATGAVREPRKTSRQTH